MRLILLVIIILSSCNSAPKILYGANREKSFSSKDDYSAFIKEKYGFNQKYFYYAEKSSYDSLLYYIVGNKVDYLLGIFKNDSVEINKSDFLLDNESCIGRIELEIKRIKDLSSLVLQQNEFFKNNSFKNILTGETLNLNGASHHKIILVVSYKLGRIHQKDFIKIERLIEASSDFELIIISLDDVRKF